MYTQGTCIGATFEQNHVNIRYIGYKLFSVVQVDMGKNPIKSGASLRILLQMSGSVIATNGSFNLPSPGSLYLLNRPHSFTGY